MKILLALTRLADASAGVTCTSECRELVRHLMDDPRSTVNFLPDPAPPSSGYSHIQQLSTGCTLGCLQESKSSCDTFRQAYVSSFNMYPVLVKAYDFACYRWGAEGNSVDDYTHSYHQVKLSLGIPDEENSALKEIASCDEIKEGNIDSCVTHKDHMNRHCVVKESKCVPEELVNHEWNGEQPCYPLDTCEKWTCRHWCKCFEKYPTIEAELEAANLCQTADDEVCNCEN